MAIDNLDINPRDLEALGLLFFQLLMADFCTVSCEPSSVLAAVLHLENTGALKLSKKLTKLFLELQKSGQPLLTDGSGGSLLRL